MKTCLLITTFNRANLLNNSLQRLCNLTIPDEILVVDDGSSDNTEQVVGDFMGRIPIRYIYHHNPNWSICSFARNIGIKNTDADIIITSEPEMIWVTDIVPLVLKEREKHPNEIISASIIYHQQASAKLHPGFITDPETALKDCIIEDYVTEPRPYHQGGYVKAVNHQATFVCMYERKWLEELGGWDESFPGAWGFDDIEIATRLRINGINQHVCKKLKAIHQWHPHLPPHVQGPAMFANEAYMQSKQLNKVEEDVVEKKRTGNYKEIDVRLIANKDREWGVIKSK